MDLTGVLLRAAAARPRVLLAVPPGATGARLAVERELRRRSWPVAASPADADVLAVCGAPGPAMTAAVRRVWGQLPAPRAWARVPTTSDAASALDRAQHGVSEGGSALPGGDEGADDNDSDLPGGLGMAERAPDRDGLALDQLHLPLGPVLPDWPAGLLLRLRVQGDVVQHAEAEHLDGGAAAAAAYWDRPWWRAAEGAPVSTAEAARRLVARQLDSLCRLLAVAGWDGAATTGRRLRDETLAGAAGSHLAPRLWRFHRRVAGSRLLRWMTRGLGRLDSAGAAGFGFSPPPGQADSDVVDRTRWWLERISLAVGLLDDERPLADRMDSADVLARPPQGGPAGTALARLARLVEGTELAATRLVVASVDPDLDRSTVDVGVGGG